MDKGKTHKDESIKSQVTGVSELLAHGEESQKLILDNGGPGGILQVLNGLAYEGVARSIGWWKNTIKWSS